MTLCGKGAVRGILTAFAAFFDAIVIFSGDHGRIFRGHNHFFIGHSRFFSGYSQSSGGHFQRYVRKRFTADCPGGYILQVFASNSARDKQGRYLSSGKACHVVQAGYFSRCIRRCGDHSGNRNQWKDNDSSNVVPCDAGGGQSSFI